MPRKLTDLTGREFGAYRVLGLSHRTGERSKSNYHWLVECIFCGTKTTVTHATLKRNRGEGCKHCHSNYEIDPMVGMYSKERDAWDALLHGVDLRQIDLRWQSFYLFLEDMGRRPPGTEIHRIDESKGYGPGNCEWRDCRDDNAE